MGGIFWFLVGATSATVCGQYKKFHETRTEMGSWSSWDERRKTMSQCPAQRNTDLAREIQKQAASTPVPVDQFQHPMIPQHISKQLDGHDFQKRRAQAQESVIYMGDATVDTLMATILAAKTKMAERKAQRVTGGNN